MKQIELTSKLVLALIAVILVTAIVTLPYQNQVANAAPTKRYQIIVTLTDVPANTGDLIMNVSILSGNTFVSDIQIKTVSSPSSGDVVKFVVRVPAGSNEDSVGVCGNTEDFTLSACDRHSLPTTGGGPIRVDYTPRPPI